MSTLNVASIQSLTTTSLPVIKNSSGVEKGQFVKAYVNFDGQGTIDANSIRSSFNVSSIDDISYGKYRVNWTASFSNTNYIVQISITADDFNAGSHGVPYFSDILTGSVQIRAFRDEQSSALVEKDTYCVAVFST